MSFKHFLTFIEIKTKLLSVLGFLVGLGFTFYYFGDLDWVNTLIFFIAMFSFDMATTAINNTMDYVKAKDEDYKHNENILGTAHISVKTAATSIFLMIATSSILGIILITRTNILLLFIGGICFIIGIFYTFGPMPLSRLPLGEVFSGATMGFGIPFIFAYVNGNNKALLDLTIHSDWTYSLSGSLIALIAIVFATYPLMCYIANVMLANNLSDIDYDIKNHRSTFPIVVGRKAGIATYEFLAYSPYVVLILAVIFKFLPYTALLTLLTAIKIVPNIRLFAKKQSKRETFSTSIQNAVLFNVALTLFTIIGTLIHF